MNTSNNEERNVEEEPMTKTLVCLVSNLNTYWIIKMLKLIESISFSNWATLIEMDITMKAITQQKGTEVVQ